MKSVPHRFICTLIGTRELFDQYFQEEFIRELAKQKSPFQRLSVSRETALRFFDYNRFKCEIIEDIPKDQVRALSKTVKQRLTGLLSSGDYIIQER